MVRHSRVKLCALRSRGDSILGTISDMSNLTSLLSQLEKEQSRLAFQLRSINNALSALGNSRSSRRGRISAAGHARIAAAQRARWAKVKGSKVVPIATHKRAISSAARRRIA